ncbi:thiamine phosphate synthase [Aciduricibacillus chroicocephali]|uniref:Thiamine phosphate synthase n=1 Tax=Aciduricibacillus chroicocephali TaxID=3054939 RepID=A0ABY9KXR1_9BACI|nr:thiamine phosphate synthase [Bacillaceae bacterium 44XB]
MLELHTISTGKQCPEKLESIAIAVAPQVDWIHIRERNWSSYMAAEIILRLRESGISQSKLVYNGTPSDEICEYAGGIHLPEHKMTLLPDIQARCKQLVIGCSVHSVKAAREAEALGADRLIFGHVFETESKPGLKPRGLEQLESVCQAVTVPVIAIGGIKLENVQRVIECGASGIAVLSGIMGAEKPVQAAISYRNHLEKRGQLI